MRPRIPIWTLGVLMAGLLVTAVLGRFAYLDLTAITAHPESEDAGFALARSAAEQQALANANPGFLYGRVTTDDGTTFEGRLRFGGSEEAFWGDDFNGTKAENPWAAAVPSDQLPQKRRGFEIFGLSFGARDQTRDLRRPFMARFGDIAHIEAQRFLVRVTMKSGTVVNLDGLEATDFDDGVRVWDAGHGIVDVSARKIRSIDFLPTARLSTAPGRLHGIVVTPQGDFSGFLQWDRQECIGSDTLDGLSAGRKISVRFDTIRSIARESADSSRVALLDGREIVLSGTHEVGRGNRGVYVDDQRYGRVLVTWDAFDRVTFSPSGSGPAYADFPPGRPLSGSITTRAGRRMVGRLVYDLDESETTDTLDAPSQRVDYTIPFALVAAIALPERDEGNTARARVTLRTGEELQLELAGDLGKDNGGLLVFGEGGQRPSYVPWNDVKGIELDSGRQR